MLAIVILWVTVFATEIISKTNSIQFPNSPKNRRKINASINMSHPLILSKSYFKADKSLCKVCKSYLN